MTYSFLILKVGNVYPYYHMKRKITNLLKLLKSDLTRTSSQLFYTFSLSFNFNEFYYQRFATSNDLESCSIKVFVDSVPLS